jgi:hypothetical protein
MGTQSTCVGRTIQNAAHLWVYEAEVRLAPGDAVTLPLDRLTRGADPATLTIDPPKLTFFLDGMGHDSMDLVVGDGAGEGTPLRAAPTDPAPSAKAPAAFLAAITGPKGAAVIGNRSKTQWGAVAVHVTVRAPAQEVRAMATQVPPRPAPGPEKK